MTLDLGPYTEARFAEAFASRAVLARKAAADLIGVDVKVFDALGLPSVLRGEKDRGYTEQALRSYLAALLTPAKAAPVRAPRVQRRPSGKVVRFTDRHKGV